MGEGEILEKGVYIATSETDPSPRKVLIEAMDEDFSYLQFVADLKPETHYFYWAYMRNLFGTVRGETYDFITSTGKPAFSSISLVRKDYTSGTLRAILRSTGDSEITESGFCYSSIQTIPSLTDDASVTVKVPCKITSDSILNAVLDGLKQQTTYYIRAYATNSFGTVYSGDGSNSIKLIVQSQAPTVTTSEISEIDMRNGGVEVGGAILDCGETDVVDAGFCWSTNEYPTLDEGYSLSVYQERDSVFKGTIEGLSGGTTYYVAAYAKNTKAVSYGEVRKIKTPEVITLLPNYIGEDVTEASACVLNGIGYILGGDLGGKRCSQLVSFDTRSNSWIIKASAKDNVKGAAFFPLNPFSILSLGGRNDDDVISNAFFYYSVGRNEWTRLRPKDESPALFGASGLAIDNVAYYFGGSSLDTMNMQVFRFNGNQESWQALDTKFPEKQLNCVAVMIGAKAYVGLGMTGNDLTGTSYSKSLWASSDFAHWDEQAVCPTKAKGILKGVFCNNRLYVLDTDLSIWAYEPEKDEWNKQATSLDSLLLSGNSYNVFMFTVDGAIYIGLTNGSKNFIKYDPVWDN